MLDGKPPAELPMERTVQTVNYAMKPKNKTNEPVKTRKRGVFTNVNFVFAHDFRIDQSWTIRTVIKHGGRSSAK